MQLNTRFMPCRLLPCLDPLDFFAVRDIFYYSHDRFSCILLDRIRVKEAMQ